MRLMSSPWFAACNPMPHTLPSIGNPAEFVGRTPWSARPLRTLFAHRLRPLDNRGWPTRASAADQGVRPTIHAGVRSRARYVALTCNLALAALAAAPAAPATRPHYGGTLHVEIRQSFETPDPPATGYGMPDLARAFVITRWEAGRRAMYAAGENAPGGRPFLDTVEIEIARPLRDQSI